MPQPGAQTQPASHATSFGSKQLRTQAGSDRGATHLITICKGSKMVAALKHRANNLQPPTFHSC